MRFGCAPSNEKGMLGMMAMLHPPTKALVHSCTLFFNLKKEAGMRENSADGRVKNSVTSAVKQ
jgi:hypothetical protein